MCARFFETQCTYICRDPSRIQLQRHLSLQLVMGLVCCRRCFAGMGKAKTCVYLAAMTTGKPKSHLLKGCCVLFSIL